MKFLTPHTSRDLRNPGIKIKRSSRTQSSSVSRFERSRDQNKTFKSNPVIISMERDLRNPGINQHTSVFLEISFFLKIYLFSRPRSRSRTVAGKSRHSIHFSHSLLLFPSSLNHTFRWILLFKRVEHLFFFVRYTFCNT